MCDFSIHFKQEDVSAWIEKQKIIVKENNIEGQET